MATPNERKEGFERSTRFQMGWEFFDPGEGTSQSQGWGEPTMRFQIGKKITTGCGGSKQASAEVLGLAYSTEAKRQKRDWWRLSKKEENKRWGSSINKEGSQKKKKEEIKGGHKKNSLKKNGKERRTQHKRVSATREILKWYLLTGLGGRGKTIGRKVPWGKIVSWTLIERWKDR